MSSDFAEGDFSSDDYEGLDPVEQDEYARAAALVEQELRTRMGEGQPQARLEPTRRVVELLGDVHRAYPIIHVAGTNGKTSTSRIIESILRSYGLTTGLFTSPHLISFNERILLDGKPIRDDVLVTNFLDIKPYVEMVDAELIAKGEQRLTYFEVLTVLAYATFADAPVDVAVVEAGLGGEWDSTNVADAVVAVFTPIDLDHVDKLGGSLDAIARTKSGIIKPASMVVSAAQTELVADVLREAAELTESTLAFVGEEISLLSTSMAVGGQLISVQGAAGRYGDIYLNLYGEHQGANAALAIAAVEAFLGGTSVALDVDVLAQALAEVESPGRLQLIGIEPTVLADAAHNPHGALSLAAAIQTFFDFEDVTVLLATFTDKDAEGIITALMPVASRFVITTAPSDRALSAQTLGQIAVDIAGKDKVQIEENPLVALNMSRSLAAGSSKSAVVVAGSISLVGLAIEESLKTQGWTL